MRSALLILGTAGCLVGCSFAVDVQRFRGAAEEPWDSGCPVRLFRDSFNLERECEMIGRVKLRDTGFTVNCGSDRIREEVREVACEIGGRHCRAASRPQPGLNLCAVRRRHLSLRIAGAQDRNRGIWVRRPRDRIVLRR